MARPVRIANCSGFYGDRLAAAREMLAGPVDGGKRRLAAGDIQSQRQQSVAVLGLEVVERAWVTRGGGDPVAALQRRLRPLATEAARSTGYEPCLVSHRTILVTPLRDRLPASATRGRP